MNEAVDYALPSNEQKSIGDVILRPDSDRLIPGVKVIPHTLWPDDRGYFLEVVRIGQGAVSNFPPASTQVSAAVSIPDAVKAFHIHRLQTDYWSPVSGMFQVALVDLRPASPAFGKLSTFYLGTLRPWQLLIPPGVGHGYKVIGNNPGLLIYLTNRWYDPTDEGRIRFDEPAINYDWTLQNK